MVQLVRIFAAKPGNLSLIPGTHTVGFLTPRSYPLTSTCTPWQHTPHTERTEGREREEARGGGNKNL